MLQWFIRFPEFAEFTEFKESSVPFRKNSIILDNFLKKNWMKMKEIDPEEHAPQ